MIEFVKYFHRFSEINARLIDLRETKNKPDTFPTNRKSATGYKIYVILKVEFPIIVPSNANQL